MGAVDTFYKPDVNYCESESMTQQNNIKTYKGGCGMSSRWRAI